MTIMQQSSQAQDRSLGTWYQHILSGQIKLPRFQRFEAWDRQRVVSFLNTIINNLPVGVTLALEVAGTEKFESRYISMAEPAKPGPVNQHLLDGQQRLTAFWRSIHNNYEGETYFVYLPQFDSANDDDSVEAQVRCIPRWKNKDDHRMPRWAEDPVQCLDRGLIPFCLLRPGDISTIIDEWLDDATKRHIPSDEAPDALKRYKAYTALRESLKGELTILRERVTHFNLPYLSLPSSTSKDVALQVFINMNTNSKPLSLYDLIVAEVESALGKSLHALENELRDECPNASRYGELDDLILSTSALLQDQVPNNRGMLDMDKQIMVNYWPKLKRGLNKMADFLARNRIFDRQRLPTNAVLSVIAACYDLIPDDGDFRGKAETLLRRYVWSAFFTDRYENSAGSRALADYKAMKATLSNHQYTEDDLITVPVLNRTEFPLADADSLVTAGWPKGTGIEARGILAVANYFQALDFADGQPASFDNLQKREYHHIFPDALLSEAKIASGLALNCALITWKTNRTIGRADPLDYLKARVEWADEETVSHRLRSHLVPYDLVSQATYKGLKDTALETKLGGEFKTFLKHRADLIAIAINQLCEGAEPSLEKVWVDYEAQKTKPDDMVTA